MQSPHSSCYTKNDDGGSGGNGNKRKKIGAERREGLKYKQRANECIENESPFTTTERERISAGYKDVS